MLLYYHSWMFYNHFIVILYHFWVLTYWHSAKCQLLFFLVFTSQKINIRRSPNSPKLYGELLWARRNTTGPGCAWGCHEEATTHQGAPWWVAPTLGAPRTASLLYKYPNIPETLWESTKINSSHRRVQNHQIQSRHHHGGVHHFHWCLSDDAWVVVCRPTGS